MASVPVVCNKVFISDLIRVLAENGVNLGPANTDFLPEGSSNLYSIFSPTAYGDTLDYSFPGTIRVGGIISGGSTDVSEHTIINVPDDQPGLVINQNLGPVVMEVNYDGDRIFTLGPGGVTLGIPLDLNGNPVEGISEINGETTISIRPAIATGAVYVDREVEIGSTTTQEADFLLQTEGATVSISNDGGTSVISQTGDNVSMTNYGLLSATSGSSSTLAWTQISASGASTSIVSVSALGGSVATTVTPTQSIVNLDNGQIVLTSQQEGNVSLTLQDTIELAVQGETTTLEAGSFQTITDSTGQTLTFGNANPTEVTVGENGSADVTINGDLTATGAVTLGTNFGPTTTILAPLIVEQGMTVNGTLTYINTEIVHVTDGLLVLSYGQPVDIVDSGIVAEYNGGTYSGIFREHGTDQWRLFSTQQDLSDTNQVNLGEITNYEDLRLRNLTASSIGAAPGDPLVGNTLYLTSEFNVQGNTISGLGTLSGQGDTITVISDVNFSGNSLFGATSIGNTGSDPLQLTSELDANGNTISEIGSLQGQGDTIPVFSDLDLNGNNILGVGSLGGTGTDPIILLSDINANGQEITNLASIGNNGTDPLLLTSQLNAQGNTLSGLGTLSGQGDTITVTSDFNMSGNDLLNVGEIAGGGAGGTLMLPDPVQIYVQGGGTVSQPPEGTNGTLDYYFGQVIYAINNGFDTLSQNLQLYFTGSTNGGFNFPTFGPNTPPQPPPSGNFSGLNQYLLTYP